MNEQTAHATRVREQQAKEDAARQAREAAARAARDREMLNR